MTIQEAKDRVDCTRSYEQDRVKRLAANVLRKDFIASCAAGTCEDPQRVAKIIWDM